jgi:hypothetical protein
MGKKRLAEWNRIFLEKLVVVQVQKKYQIFYETKCFYLVHNSPLLDPILSQINSIHTLTPYFFKIHLNIITM